ncbi:S41 family peptidase [Roseivirga sp. E12]|uniref:S41 family peptidase n=1 Tax=Roseivirga sp. E12 TaxID=2819237 RepID=UPI001ABCC09E|nr:S41 family peptidase [Roseivirga sp. E12]MBO3697597.1 S41 family peptidase [Roseivirga sp. E12]
MDRLSKFAIIVSFNLVIVSCQPEEFTPVFDRPGNELEDYLKSTINLMQINSINRKTIDWDNLRTRVLNVMGTDSLISEANAPLKEALRLLNDNHSLIVRPDGTHLFARTVGCSGTNANTHNLPDNIGYVKVRTFSGSSDTQEGQFYIQEIRNQIRAQDKENLIGWVVDIRGNLGGSMYPMIAGIGPILGEGTAGHFIDPDGSATTWGYTDHKSTLDGRPVAEASDRYELLNSTPRVAVLIDGAVASSGEAVAISFIGREDTKLFGSASCGASTANKSFTLKDDSSLHLTVSYMADRNTNKFGEEIIPDQVSSPEKIVEDVVVWMNQ